MKATISNVTGITVGKMKAGSQDQSEQPFYRDIEVECGTGETLTIRLGAWKGSGLAVKLPQGIR